jgi:hypothetical protein
MSKINIKQLFTGVGATVVTAGAQVAGAVVVVGAGGGGVAAAGRGVRARRRRWCGEAGRDSGGG